METVPFLKNGPTEFIATILQKLTLEIYLNGDYIAKETTTGKEMYFIRNGDAQVTVDYVEVSTLTDGAYFGGMYLIHFVVFYVDVVMYSSRTSIYQNNIILSLAFYKMPLPSPFTFQLYARSSYSSIHSPSLFSRFIINDAIYTFT